MRLKFIPLGSWFIRSPLVPIPVCLFSLFPGPAAVPSSPFPCTAETAFFSLPCKCTPPSPYLLAPQKEERAGRWTEKALARPRNSQYHVYFCPWIYLIYTSTLEKRKIPSCFISTSWWGKKCFLIFHFFCLHDPTLLFYRGWLVQGSWVIDNLFQGLLHFLTNSLLDFAAPLRHLSEASPAYVSNCWYNLSLLREKSTEKDIIFSTFSSPSTFSFCKGSAKTSYSITHLWGGNC